MTTPVTMAKGPHRSFAFSPAWAPAAAFRGPGPAARSRQLKGQERRHEDKGDCQKCRTSQAPGRDGDGCHDRAQGDAHLAPDGKDAHRRCLLLACVVVHEARPLGVKRRDPDSAQDDHCDGEPVIGQQGAEGYAAARHPDACRDQPGLGQTVRVEPEEGLDDGGGDAQGGNQARGRRVAQLILGDEKGQKGRHGPLVEIREQVPQGGQPDKTIFHGGYSHSFPS